MHSVNGIGSNWAKPSAKLKELQDLAVRKELNAKVDELVERPGISEDVKIQVQVMANSALKPLLEQNARRILQLDALGEEVGLLKHWNDFQESLDSLKVAAAVLKGYNFGEDVFSRRAVKESDDFVVQVNGNVEIGQHEIKILRLAKASVWNSNPIKAASKAPFVKSACGASKDCIEAGDIKIKVHDNKLVSSVLCAAKDVDITGSAAAVDKFGVGTVYVNDKVVEIAVGDTLEDLVSKINDVAAGVTAVAEQSEVDPTKYVLVLYSDKPGIENQIDIQEAGAALMSDRMAPAAHYEAVTVRVGDTLSDVVNSINDQKEKHGVSAWLEKGVGGSRKLKLKSSIPGVGNAIEIMHPSFQALFQDSTGKINVVPPQDAAIEFDGEKMEFKGNDFDVEMPGGGHLHIELLNQTRRKKIFKIEPAYAEIMTAIDNFLTAYFKVLSFLAFRDEDKLLYGAIYNNVPEELKFTQVIEDIGLEALKASVDDRKSGILDLKKIGINFRSEKLSSYKFDQADSVSSLKQLGAFVTFEAGKLHEALQQDFQGVRKLFECVIEGSNLIRPHQSEGGGGVNNALESVSFDIDETRATVKSNVSKLMPKIEMGVVKSGNFMLNGQLIEVSVGENLDSLAVKINDLLDDTGVVAAVKPESSGYRLVLMKDKGFDKINHPLVQWPPVFADYDDVLSGLFNTDNASVTSSSFAASDVPVTNASGKHDDLGLFTPGTFYINGQSVVVNAGDSLETIVTRINEAEAGVVAIVDKPDPAKSDCELKIVATTEVKIDIRDDDRVLNAVLGGVQPMPHGGIRFFDTSKVARLAVERFGESIPRKALYLKSQFGKLGARGGIATVRTFAEAEDRYYGLSQISVYYLGKGQDSFNVKMSRGLAADLFQKIERMLKYEGLVLYNIRTMKDLLENEQRVIREFEANDIANAVKRLQSQVIALSQVEAKRKEAENFWKNLDADKKQK